MCAYRSQRGIVVLAATALALAACGSMEKKADEEAAKNTFACQSGGERIVIRFDRGEARVLMPSGERVTLYEVPSASGPRYTNGALDLYGKGADLQLARDGGAPAPLTGCASFAAPAPRADRAAAPASS